MMATISSLVLLWVIFTATNSQKRELSETVPLFQSTTCSAAIPAKTADLGGFSIFVFALEYRFSDPFHAVFSDNDFTDIVGAGNVEHDR